MNKEIKSFRNLETELKRVELLKEKMKNKYQVQASKNIKEKFK